MRPSHTLQHSKQRRNLPRHKFNLKGLSALTQIIHHCTIRSAPYSPNRNVTTTRQRSFARHSRSIPIYPPRTTILVPSSLHFMIQPTLLSNSPRQTPLPKTT